MYTSEVENKITSLSLDEQEKWIATYLEQERPELLPLYLSYVPKARQGILHRFVQAIVREQLIPQENIVRTDENEIRLLLSEVKTVMIPVRRMYSLDRLEIEGDIMIVSQGESKVLFHPVQLLELLIQEKTIPGQGSTQQLNRFRQELQNSVANYALAFAGAEVRAKELKQKAAALGVESAIELVQAEQEKESNFSPLIFFEQWVVDGHPLHPGAKIKMGLSVADVIAYSPEWGARPDVRLIAVEKEKCAVNTLTEQSITEILYHEYPQLKESVHTYLQQQGLDGSKYELIPLHAWQYEHTLPLLCQEEIEQKVIVPLNEIRIPTAALMSFRSLAPLAEDCKQKHHIKTAVNVQTTGAVRTVSPYSAENGPRLSRLMRDIQQREKGFFGSFVILEERASAYYKPIEHVKESDTEHWTKSKNLAGLLRENPESYLKEGEIAMPGSALIARSPLSDQPIVAELINQYGKNCGMKSMREAAAAFVREYAQICLPGFLTMMTRYGISLEGHLQNSVPVFKNGQPVRMVVRDFGGVRIVKKRLEQQGMTIEFYPGSAIVTEDIEDMRNKIYYPVFQNHFGEVLLTIARAFDLEEAILWQEVADVCRLVFDKLKQDINIAAQAEADEAALFSPTLGLKCMATMRLLNHVTKYSFASVSNPLVHTTGGEKR
jgi:siderophore synthetase component